MHGPFAQNKEQRNRSPRVQRKLAILKGMDCRTGRQKECVEELMNPVIVFIFYCKCYDVNHDSVIAFYVVEQTEAVWIRKVLDYSDSN